MPSAFIPSALRFPAMPLARQQLHQWCVHSGPLVLGTAPLMIPTPTMDRDRTVSRRSEPEPLERRRGQLAVGLRAEPNLPVDVDSWGRSACYPRGSFYPLSDGFSTQYRRIIKPYFRLCSNCHSRSQAPFCLCTLRMVSIHSEGTFGRLRYSFGGDRPSQTVHLTLSITRFHGSMLEFQ